MASQTEGTSRPESETSKLVARLNSYNPHEIRLALESVTSNETFLSVEKVRDYSVFILQHIGEEHFEDVCRGYINYLIQIIENTGQKKLEESRKNGKFDNHARELLALADAEKYKHLLADETIAKSVKVVREHYKEEKHSPEYEAHLNHLYGVFKELGEIKKSQNPQ